MSYAQTTYFEEMKLQAAQASSLQEARRYCFELARSHYENFSLASHFLPGPVRQDIYNVYAFCRCADDLADELGDCQKALAALAWWKEQLDACFQGRSSHPVFVALQETAQRLSIPKEPFADLLHAFEMDQGAGRWGTFEQLLGYCRYSANPVGRLVLYVFGYRDPVLQALSDQTCTGLQLANFWQDVARDFRIGRIYLPQEDMERFGVFEEDIEKSRATPEFRECLRFQVNRTRAFFRKGLELVSRVDKNFRLEVLLFNYGGMRVLDLVEGQDFDVLSRRPALTKTDKIQLFLKAWIRKWKP